MKSLRLSYFELHDIHPRVKWKSGRGQKLALSPGKNYSLSTKFWSCLKYTKQQSDWFSQCDISWQRESFFVKMAFFCDFVPFSEIRQFHTHLIFLLKEIWLQEHVLQTTWKLCGKCVNFFRATTPIFGHAHFFTLRADEYHVTRTMKVEETSF